MRRSLRWAMWCAIVVVTIARISYLPLIDPDEAHYAQITREMRQLGDYLVPRIDGTPIIDKPALFHWLQAGTMAVFGEGEFGARLPTAAASLALLAVTFWIGKRLFDPDTGEAAALMLMLTPLTFALANFAIFDTIFNAFLFTSFGLLVVAAVENRPRLQIGAFLLLSCAIQIKGPFVLIVLPAVAILASFSKPTRQIIRRIYWIPGLTAAVVLALPWFLLMWRRFGHDFINDYVLLNNVQLFGASLYRQTFYPFFYLRSGAASLFPWSLMLVGALADFWRLRKSGDTMSPARVLLWSWTAVIFGFFSASHFKLDHYIFPLAPAVCLLVANTWRSAAVAPARRFTATFVSMIIVSVVLVLIGGAGTALLLIFDTGLPAYALAFSIGIAAGGVLWLLKLMRSGKPTMTFAPLLTTLAVLYAAVMLVGFPYFDDTRPGYDLGVWLQAHVQPGDDIVIYNQGRWKASLRFYAEHPVLQTTVESQFLDEWRQPNRVYAVLTEDDLAVLRRAGLSFSEVDRESAVVGNTGRWLRRQVWGSVLIITNHGPSATDH